MAKHKIQKEDGPEGHTHKPRRVCPHLAAEFYDNNQADIGDEMLRPLRADFRAPARENGRQLPKQSRTRRMTRA